MRALARRRRLGPATLAALAITFTASPANAATVLTWVPLDSDTVSGTPLIASGELGIGTSIADVVAVDADESLHRFSGDEPGLNPFGSAADTSVPGVDIAVGKDQHESSDDVAVAVDDGDATEDVQVWNGRLISSAAAVADTVEPTAGADAATFGDLNGDGLDDLVAFGGTTIAAFINTGTADPFPATASFTAGTGCDTDPDGPTAGHDVASDDLNGDGRDDVAVVCTSAGDNHRFLSFESSGSSLSQRVNSSFQLTATDTGGVKLADVIGDGHPDAVYWTSGKIRVASGQGTASLNTISDITVAGTIDAAVADLDLDGDRDIAALVPSSGNRVIRPFLNDGNGSFTVGADHPAPATATSIAALKLTRDAAPELVMARSGGIDTLRSAPVVETAGGAFGHQTQGQATPVMPIIVQNTGAGRLSLGARSTTGSATGDYSVVSDSCASRSFDRGESCIVAVAFTPAAIGARNATLSYAGNAATPISVALTGTGVAATGGSQGAQGPQGPAGTNGTNGEDGAQGPPGSTGVAGPAGPSGGPGPQGPAGPEGPAGPQGPAGRDAKVTCKAPKRVKRGAKSVKITCTVRLAARTRVKLKRGRRTVARGVVSRSGRVVLKGRRPRPGTYMLVVDGTYMLVVDGT